MLREADQRRGRRFAHLFQIALAVTLFADAGAQPDASSRRRIAAEPLVLPVLA